jgi:hypothetical protein
LLLDLRARGVSSRRDGSKIFLQITPLNTLRASTLNTTVHALALAGAIATGIASDMRTRAGLLIVATLFIIAATASSKQLISKSAPRTARRCR